jgi:hypothetical protein
MKNDKKEQTTFDFLKDVSPNTIERVARELADNPYIRYSIIAHLTEVNPGLMIDLLRPDDSEISHEHPEVSKTSVLNGIVLLQALHDTHQREQSIQALEKLFLES